LSLVAAAISAVEILVVFSKNPTGYLSDFEFWLLTGVFALSMAMYFRVKRERKKKIG
jgi:phosphotransferase system  glucose/maltose/N-acetylglucosamine-specific IIC component